MFIGKSTLYRRNLPHIESDQPYFVTFCTKGRWVLPEFARDKVMESCLYEDERKARVAAAVVMPDHVHIVFTALANATGQRKWTLREVMQSIKGASAHAVNKFLHRRGPVWQEESFDRVLRSSEKFDEKIRYVINNPVRRGLAEDWRTYRWTYVRDAVELCSPPQARAPGAP